MFANAQPEVAGVGLGYRMHLHDQILSAHQSVDFLEAISDQFIYATPDRLERLQAALTVYPIVPHSLSMSVGTAEEVDAEYLRRNANFVKSVNAPWFSDHLCMTRVDELDLGSLTPLWFTDELVEIVIRNVNRIKETVPSRPFLLENITYYVSMPRSTMTESEFVTKVIEGADCGLLLDVNNVYVNAQNQGYDPYEFLKCIPLDRVVQAHIAGYEHGEQVLIDTHSSPVSDEVWDLLEVVCRNSPLRAISLERDSNFPDFSEMIEELNHARNVLKRCGRYP